LKPRRLIAELAADPTQPTVLLCGRVLARRGEDLLLADGSGSLELRAGDDIEAGPGDWVELGAERTPDGALVVRSLRVVGRYRLRVPFPSPGGEHFRLHRGQPSRFARLHERARALRAIRAFFDRRGYLEVQTPQLVSCPGLEPHLRALPAGEGQHLITSPEYQMKRLLAGGFERIYFLGACWRGDEVGHQHLREFCMLEWYRAFCDIDELMRETEELVAALAVELRGTTRIGYQDRPLELEPPFLRLSVAQAFARHAGVELAGVTSTDELRRRAEAAGLGPFGPDEGFEAIASRVLVERVEPALAAAPRPVFLHDFPAPLAALSRLRADNPTVAERFELYAGGLELGNAFGELTDVDEQRRRLREDQRARARAGAPVHPLDERFLAALAEGIPPAAGIAVGVDRLLMLLLDAADIREVVAFAQDEL
jgi:elongation factor P--(R)-beta-lysine ligase